jgi:hypothetical protein
MAAPRWCAVSRHPVSDPPGECGLHERSDGRLSPKPSVRSATSACIAPVGTLLMRGSTRLSDHYAHARRSQDWRQHRALHDRTLPTPLADRLSTAGINRGATFAFDDLATRQRHTGCMIILRTDTEPACRDRARRESATQNLPRFETVNHERECARSGAGNHAEKTSRISVK